MTDVPFRIGLEGQPDIAAVVPGRAGWLVRGLLAVALVGAAAWLGYAIAFSRGLDQLHAAAQQRLAVEAAQLDGYLLRFEYLPSLLETSPDVYRLLGTPDDRALQQNVSLYLKSINLLAGADNLYVLSVAGDALAAADFDQPGTPVGSNLSYRPYMRQALATGRGAFFGIGITSARAGYYLSYAVKRQGQTIGVAVVKVNLDAFEREWRNRGSDMVLVDARGVTILASRDEWRLRPLTPLSVDALEEIATSKPYGSSSLEPLGWAFTETADRGGRVSTGRGADYSVDERPLNGRQWRLLLLDDETPVRRTAFIIGALSGFASIAALLALGLFAQRRNEIRQRLASQAALQAANDRLEIRVQERTAELRAAQDELVHAGKLAVLGQMSAGLVHEINQPLAALQTTADNAIQFVDRGLIGEVRGNLVRIGELVRRLGRLTSQLRVFAYKSNEPLDAVSVEQALSETLKILSGRVKDGGVELTIDLAPGLHVTADQTRLEQLFCNIVANALDAVDGAAQRSIHIQAVREDGPAARCHVAISNSGPAIAPEVLQRLFEPFVTTKPAGKGLGLGLVLANHIARSFGGELQARNLEPSGAEFVVLLPLAD
ncbi:two-component C4-dicarboxylate transport system, sensor protein [Bradyrhizobium oligotrophicum S58]|uniref:C4-dicarboxylate transport sensor protein DctB n=1 Tax=Bradyrhizobium oligotrophicum S58 TaxID=1245469 RepID=M4ZC00_9BRAD|nr:ATP-binding protein [Bradyrhizobium oligotrophicum]BAM91272.1 two-component C4-dicarboxylate transport system, sensor protein [Bradyrhizobium oligotrophicum S58]